MRFSRFIYIFLKTALPDKGSTHLSQVPELRSFLFDWNMMKIFIFALAILLTSSNAHAATEGDEAPESDIGLAAESAPDDTGSRIPEVTFTVVDDAPVIDGELIEVFWKHAQEFSLDIELYPTRLARKKVRVQG